MTNRAKNQKKELKNRTERAQRAKTMRNAGVHADRNKTSNVYDRGQVAKLLARGEMINTRALAGKDIMDMINHTIETNAGIGSLVETLEILSREHKVVISDEMQACFDEFDKDVVKFNENAEVLSVLIGEKTKIGDIPPELLLDTGFRSDRLVSELAQQVLGFAKDYTQIVNEYQKEHHPSENYREVMFTLALQRLARVTAKYKTTEVVNAEEVTDADDKAEINSILDNKESV